MARPSRTRSRVDISDLVDFQKRLETAAVIVEKEAEDFQETWGERWAQEMRGRVPTGPGEPVHLRDEIQQVEPGGLSFGQAYWWRFLEYGTSKMGPRPFIRPSMRTIRKPARADAGERAINLIHRGLR